MEHMQSTSLHKVTFRIQRYNPEQDAAPRWETRRLEVHEGMTVLEALHAIKGEQDGSLAWRASCRMGICGSCGMYINGLPRLACQTQVLPLCHASPWHRGGLAHLESGVVVLAPLPNYPIVKDLVPDLMPMFEHHAAIKPYLVRDDGDEMAHPGGEFLQSPEEREAYGQFSYCIKCGLCLSACPTVATDPLFLGPQALAQALRYTADNRDDGLVLRLESLDRLHGPYQCHMAGACSDACPKGVDPALGIQLLKRELSLEALGLRRRKRPAAVAPLAQEYVANEKIAAPPPRTV